MPRHFPITAILFLAALTGCGDSPSNESAGTIPANPVAEETPAPEETPNLMFAEGWHEVVVRSGYTDTHVNVAGHYYIERDRCHVGAQGSMGVEAWNPFVTVINSAVPAPQVAETQETCVSFEANGEYAFNGWVDIKLPDGKKKEKVVEVRGANVCSRFIGKDAMTQLVGSLNKLLPQAFTEDCQLGR